jgi:hypothetical protein
MERTGKSSNVTQSTTARPQAAKKPARISKKVELGSEPVTFDAVAKLIVRDLGMSNGWQSVCETGLDHKSDGRLLFVARNPIAECLKRWPTTVGRDRN